MLRLDEDSDYIEMIYDVARKKLVLNVRTYDDRDSQLGLPLGSITDKLK